MSQSASADVALTPVNRFGRDHWSLLAYIEDLCVNGVCGRGKISPSRMRCNTETHPQLSHTGRWEASYSTRLAGYVAANAPNDQLIGHDDWDCLVDLEGAGYVEIHSMTNGMVTLTLQGADVAGLLRTHKAKGGTFARFTLPDASAA